MVRVFTLSTIKDNLKKEAPYAKLKNPQNPKTPRYLLLFND